MLGKVFAVALSEHKVVQSRSSIQLTSKLHLTCQPFITRLQPRQIKLFKAQSIRIKCVLSEKTPNSTTAPSIQSIDQTLPPPAPCPLSSTQSFMLKGTGKYLGTILIYTNMCCIAPYLSDSLKNQLPLKHPIT